MAATARYTLTKSAYTLIGENVQWLSIEERAVFSFRVIVQPHNDGAPLVGATNYLHCDGNFNYSDGPADIYARSNGGDLSIGVLAKDAV